MKKLIKKLFRCPQDRRLIMVWAQKTMSNSLGQYEIDYKISLGRYTVFTYTYVYTPLIGQ